MKRFLAVFLLIGFFLSRGELFAAFQEINPAQQLKYTTLAEGESVVGASSSQVLTNKTIDDDDNTIQDLALSAFKTIAGEANKFLSRDGSGNATATKTVPAGDVVGTTDDQTLTSKHISGGQIDSGTIAEARIDSTIARDVEIPGNASFTLSGLSEKLFSSLVGAPTNASYTFFGLFGSPATTSNELKPLRLNAGGTALEYYNPTTGATFKRADVVLTTATSTVTFVNDVEGNPVVIGTFQKCILLINGLGQKYTNFTKTSATVAESTQGNIASGSLVTLLQMD